MSLYAIHSAGTARAVYIFPADIVTPPGGTPSGSDVRTFINVPQGLTRPIVHASPYLGGSELLISDEVWAVKSIFVNRRKTQTA